MCIKYLFLLEFSWFFSLFISGYWLSDVRFYFRFSQFNAKFFQSAKIFRRYLSRFFQFYYWFSNRYTCYNILEWIFEMFINWYLKAWSFLDFFDIFIPWYFISSSFSGLFSNSIHIDYEISMTMWYYTISEPRARENKCTYILLNNVHCTHDNNSSHTYLSNNNNSININIMCITSLQLYTHTASCVRKTFVRT